MLTMSTLFLPKMSEEAPMMGAAMNWRREKREPSRPVERAKVTCLGVGLLASYLQAGQC